jgi:glycosyltransferase involved in cell wall biosynthesis
MKNILFISYDGMTDPLGQSQVIPYLSGLTKYGYKFTILSCDKPGKYEEHQAYVHSLLKGLPIKWVSIPYHKSPPILSSVYDLFQIKKTISRLQKQEPFDMVHTRPGVPTLAALWMKKKYGTKFLNDIRGFWADERVDGGMWNLANPLYKRVYKYFKEHEMDCIVSADYNTCLTNAAEKEIRTWKDLQQLKIKVIPCSADLELFNAANISEAKKDELRESLGIRKDDVIISYLGSIGGWYLTKDMMQFCKMLSDKLPSARFLFISPHRHEQIAMAAAQAGLSESRLITVFGKRHEVPALLSLSAYSLFFIKPCYSKLSSSPTKHGEIMAMGIPVITNSGVGDVKEIVDNAKGGFITDDFSKNSFAHIISQIADGAHFDKKLIRQNAEEIYSLSKAVESYAFVYNEILE